MKHAKSERLRKQNTYTLFDKDSEAFFYNLKATPIQRMLDFDYLCQRKKPSIVAIIHPGTKGIHKAFFGAQEIIIPVYSSIIEAAHNHPRATAFINFASFRSSYQSSKEALLIPKINVVAIVAEGMPERQTRELIALTRQYKKTIIGPSTVGGIVAGQFRIGYAGGMMENIINAKLYRPGSIGLVSKSGGMMNELFNIIARTTNGIYEGIAIGGDAFPGSTLLDHILRYEANPNIKLIIALSELGGQDEYEIIKAKQTGKITKPLIMWCSGTCAKIFPWSVQFGHAGAKADKAEETADAKNKALRDVGIIVPPSFEQLEPTIKETFQKLLKQGKIPSVPEMKPAPLPLDMKDAVKQGLVRRQTEFITTISSDIGEEPTYGTTPISEIVQKNYSVGDVISLLWFKKKFPPHISKYLELCIILTADHGPAVSGAHNAIVTARAGKDVISSLCSGLLTIGPRFGGAIDDAARYFKHACDAKTPPYQFVEEMKQKSILIPGIGHRVKSKRNPDKRVELLKSYAKKNFSSTKYLDYALSVEKITLQKAENLILNVDGCMAVTFLDALTSSKSFSLEEINDILEIGYLNGLFALARSIGFIGHILDQKRLKSPLYRHPTDDILYMLEERK